MKDLFEHSRLRRAALLMVAAIVIDVSLGWLVQTRLQWPLFLDSVGTILSGALLGPLAGAAVGMLSNVIEGLLPGSGSAPAYAVTAAFIGWAAGYAASLGAFRRLWSVALTGLLVGLGALLISAPITAYVFHGVTGTGMDQWLVHLRNTGANLLQIATVQGFLSDPFDKLLSFLLAWSAWRLLRRYFRRPRARGPRALLALDGYGIAVAASLLALLLAFVFLPAFGPSILSVFYLAVLVSAWRGGLGPALLTTAMGLAANILLWLSPFYQADSSLQDGLRILVFVIVSLAIAAIAYRLEQNKRALAASLQAERGARAGEQAVTNAVDEALLVLSPERRVVQVNRRFSELFGVPASRIDGQHLDDTRSMFTQAFGEPDDFYRHIDNEDCLVLRQTWPEARELELYTRPIQDGDTSLGRLLVFRDVTHQREVERMKTEFVSLVSHELRTPLTSIKGYTEMVLDGDAGDIDAEVREFLEIVLSNAERLVALVNDLLDISRIESGRIQVELRPVDLGEVVQVVRDTMQQKLQEKGQTLSVDIDPAAASVLGDRDKLVQVLTNYVGNAYKYTPAGGHIGISIQRRDGFARVEVSDDGHGIADDDQAQLFTQFYRVDNSMTREVGGTGLGLSIVKKVVELQGGEVGVTSRLGEGSRFHFTVPVSDVAPAAVPSAAVMPPAGGAILVVEDDPDIARLIAHHLGQAGYQVQTAADAETALQHLQDAIPDLITLDIDLPGMSGDELAARLKADPLTADIPVLVLSVLSDQVQGADGLRFGAYALPKPIAQDELLARVAELLQHPEPGPVLVIDDDPDVRQMLRTALQKHGYEADVAADGEQGLARVREQRPGLILLDLRLPGIDGFGVLRALKDDPATVDIPVIALTGNAELKNSARAQMLALGASDFIAKPFDMERLIEEIGLFMVK